MIIVHFVRLLIIDRCATDNGMETATQPHPVHPRISQFPFYADCFQSSLHSITVHFAPSYLVAWVPFPSSALKVKLRYIEAN